MSRVTDEMIEAFGQQFWPINARTKIDAMREELRAALEVALSPAPSIDAEAVEALKAAKAMLSKVSCGETVCSFELQDAINDTSRAIAALAPDTAARMEAEREECEYCSGRGEIGGTRGQTAESFEYVTEECPACGGSGSTKREGV